MFFYLFYTAYQKTRDWVGHVRFFFLSLFILRETETSRVGRGRKRKRERERFPSRLHAASTEPNVGLKPTKP